MNAWPALESMVYDGWVLRFADGYTRRSNSVNPLYLSSERVRSKIARCEQVYRSKGLRIVFKMTRAAQPPGLDGILERLGYQTEAPTSVQVIDLSSFVEHRTVQVSINETPDRAWIEPYCELNAVSETNRVTLTRMLASIAPAGFFATMRVGGRVAGCGMGVVERGFVGLFDVVIAADVRGRGLGKALMHSLLGHGKRCGATTAYLQVMLENLPAIRLYAGLGFREAYRYWYRTR